MLDPAALTIKSHDPWADIDNKFYERVTAYQQKGIKVLIAIGGWNDSTGDKYGRLLTDTNVRRNFIASVVAFIEKYKFNGLDLDLEVSLAKLNNDFKTNQLNFFESPILYSIRHAGKIIVNHSEAQRKLDLQN